MPKTCTHLEKVERIIKQLNVEYSNNRWSRPHGPCLKIEYASHQETKIKGTADYENAYYFDSGIQIVYYRRGDTTYWDHSGSTSEYIIAKIESLKEGEIILNRVKNEIISIINECNCGNENNQQLILRRDAERSLTSVRTERDDLQVAKRNLDSRVSDLQSSNWSLQSANTTLQNQLTQKDKDIEWGKGQLAIKEKEKEQLKNERDDYKNKWVLSDREVKKITDSFNALQLESAKKEKEIISLREELEGSQNIDLRYKKKKLDELTRNLGLDWQKVRNLCEAYERLKKASDRENYNQGNITAAQTDINNIEREFFQTNVNIDDLHKVYKTCEKMAELRVKQEKIRQQQQQQYQAHQEQSTNR